MRLPQSFRNAVGLTAKSLNHSFNTIGALPIAPEHGLSARNTFVHLGASFLATGFAVYAEAQTSASTHQIELVATNRKIAFNLSVHAFGKLLPGKILQQAQTLKSYEAHFQAQRDTEAATSKQAPELWAAILIQSFAGEEFNALWHCQIAAPETFEQSLREFAQLDNAGKEDFSELANCLRGYEAYTGTEPISRDTNARLDLLWTAFPLRP